MNEQRQQAFLKLKPPCVNLSSVALKLRTKDASAKDVLRALESVREVLDDLGKKKSLDPKLAEYAFFPLAQQVFNEAKHLSPRCLEVACECVALLVVHGYGPSIVPELGKQLLILMSMLAGAGPTNQSQPPTDELKIAAFKCMQVVIEALASNGGSPVLDDQGTRNVVDQLVYVLLDAITDSRSDQVQIVSSGVLLSLITAIKSRVFLSSLLPRTVSSLTKALKLSTKVKRTQKVLTTNLRVLRRMLDRTLADRVAIVPTTAEEKEAIGESWLRATAAQIKNALLQVVKLRSSESSELCRALEELCVMVIEECHTTLSDCLPVMIETLIILSARPDGQNAQATCKHLITTYPDVADMLRSSFMSWSRSLPRLMQSADERPRQLALHKVTASLQVLPDSARTFVLDETFANTLVDSVGSLLKDAAPVIVETQIVGDNSVEALVSHSGSTAQHFEKFLLARDSQRDTTAQLYRLVNILKDLPEGGRLTRYLVDVIAEQDGVTRVASTWLALQLLRNDGTASFAIEDLLEVNGPEHNLNDRSSILGDLHAATIPFLASVYGEDTDDSSFWQMQALAIETTVMYAQSFRGDLYRPELIETLYPVLSFLGSPNAVLRSHARTALDMLASTCQYPSTTQLIIENVDYLVNSVAWKLNTYSLSPEAPQILRMIVQLCGAELVPYLDDLIQSIFAALDSYHGYPEWVEALFASLKSMVDVSVKKPHLAITQGKERVCPKSEKMRVSDVCDISDDLTSRKRRKIDFDRSAHGAPTKAPRRQWTDALDGPSFPKPPTTYETELKEDDAENEHLSPMKPPNDEEKKLTKSHNLLLAIARSTVPHMASPSLTVRHILLDLLKDISTLLGQDEDSFLPLVNTIWPMIVPRLFAEQTTDGVGNEEETAYNICAAADTIGVLCQNAGDFMASRIEGISTQLFAFFRRTSTHMKDAPTTISNPSVTTLVNSKSGQSDTIAGPVDPQVVKSSHDAERPQMSRLDDQRSHLTQARSSKSQILSALIDLLVLILNHVSLTLDTGDEIMKLLLPFMRRKDSVYLALTEYNADAVWLFERQTSHLSGTTSTRVQSTVRLRQELQDQGLELM